MLIKQPEAIKTSEITSRTDYRNRRRFIRDSALSAIALASPAFSGTKLKDLTTSAYQLDDELTSYDDITSYNNFYEFGVDKSDPKIHSKNFKPKPWSLSISGECAASGTFDLEDFISPYR